MVSEHIRFEVISASTGSISLPVDDPFFYALAGRLSKMNRDSVAGPVVSVGYTDSNYLRPFGAKAYGFVPVLVVRIWKVFMGTMKKLSMENMHTGNQETIFGGT